MVSSSAFKYARALADVAFELGSAEAVQKELATFAGVVAGHAELRASLASPAFPLHVKRGILEAVAAKCVEIKIVRNFLLVLLERGRLAQLEDIVEAYGVVLDEASGVVRVSVSSARVLRDETKGRLAAAMEEMTGKKVRLSYMTDESLVGGLRLQVGSTVYDGTVLSELEHLGRHLAISSN